MSTPLTPVHPAANQEVDALPDGTLPESTIQDLDLNPDLYEDDDEEKMATAAEMDESVSNGINITPFTLPFDDLLVLTGNEFEANTLKTETLSLLQQSRLVNYLDDELLAIQRIFIKSHVEGDLGYHILELLKELSRLIDLIWFSVNANNKLFGQENILIKILSDLEDYINKYDFPPNPEVTGDEEAALMRFFIFFQIIDVRILFLYDGYHTNVTPVTQKLSATEIVRLSPSISALRIIIVDKIDKFKRVLAASDNENSIRLLRVLDLETGKLFEGILDRM